MGLRGCWTGCEGKLGETLCMVTSKSGGTPETRNGMLVVAEAYRAAGLEFRSTRWRSPCRGRSWTGRRSSEGWLARMPMFDWVGGRTSETSAVGLLPAALQGIDIDGLLAGAAACDEATR
jgi:glucose-6-phosphate isomerase